MFYQIILISLSIVAINTCLAQDILVTKDSTRIEVMLLEVRQTEVKYKLLNHQDGPNNIISKNEIAYIIYTNGTRDIFNQAQQTEEIQQNTIHVDLPEQQNSAKLGDYIKFNIQLGFVRNSLSSNYIRRGPQESRTTSASYSPSNGKNVYNFNIGFNFLFGKNPFIKHVIGINYLRSIGEYNYQYSHGGYTSYKENFHYKSKIDFINVVTGLRFKLFKTIYIEPLIAINVIVKSDVRYSGTSTTSYISGGPNPSVYKEETDYYLDKKVDAERTGINSTVSLCPRVWYEFNLKKQTLGVYASYNLAYKFRLPWLMAGISYYPFRKLK